MLSLAKEGRLGTREHQREAGGQLGARQRANLRFDELRQGCMAMLKERLRPELNLARCGRKTLGVPEHIDLGVLGIARSQCDAHAGRLGAELFQAYAAGPKLMAVSGIDVAVPEVFGKTEPCGEAEDEIGVGPCLSRRRHDRLAKLHEGLCLSIDFESDLQCLPLEA